MISPKLWHCIVLSGLLGALLPASAQAEKEAPANGAKEKPKPIQSADIILQQVELKRAALAERKAELDAANARWNELRIEQKQATDAMAAACSALADAAAPDAGRTIVDAGGDTGLATAPVAADAGVTPVDASVDARGPSASDGGTPPSDPVALLCEERRKEVARLAKELERLDVERKRLEDEVGAAKKALDDAEGELRASAEPRKKLKDRLYAARRVRCMTAICWGDRYQYGAEPLVDLPVGIAWSVGGGALSSYINSTPLSIEFNAGLRIWIAHDLISFSVFFAKPVARAGDTIRLRGSETTHDVGRIHRPFPSVAIGLLGDMMQIGVAYDVLTNSSGDNRDHSYPPNAVLSRSLTFTLGFATFTAARNLIGLAK